VSNQSDHRIDLFGFSSKGAWDGELAGRFGSLDFSRPAGIAVDETCVFVCDLGRQCIAIANREDLLFDRSIASLSGVPSCLLESDRRHNEKRYDEAFNFLKPPSSPEQVFLLFAPYRIAVDNKSKLLFVIFARELKRGGVYVVTQSGKFIAHFGQQTETETDCDENDDTDTPSFDPYADVVVSSTPASSSSSSSSSSEERGDDIVCVFCSNIARNRVEVFRLAVYNHDGPFK
jgi:hypothetical protein